ncbi:hypothetical protein Tco_1018789 [Tanacetum coccineum]|uniref:Uncharacterized protein n=1 Tax=Tanacetum coccineum TaxID=301880 RepID=A0ABQ5FWE9_9ASTR
MDDSLIVSKGSLIEPENNDAFSKSEIETHMQRQEEKVDMREAVDAGLVVTESSGTKPDKQNTSSSSGSYTTQAVDADIRPVIDEEPFAEENPESHSGSMSSMKNLDDTYNFGDQFLYDKPTEDDQEKSKVIEESDSTIPDPITPPPINTEATTITTSLPEITPFIALQLRVARLEQEMSEVKKTDHSADVLASIKSQVPTSPSRIKESEKGPKGDYTESKSANRNTANYHLYHALMEALIADEDAMDKEVADKVKNHKRKHDSDDDDEDDDDDEGP